MRILGIESSCDETGGAIIEDGIKILSNFVASSERLHIKTGGIIPETAAREQIKYIIPTINEAMEQYSDGAIDALAVTVGPGLIGSLLIGVETAKTLSYLWNKPIVPVNHLIAHLYANWLETRRATNGNTKGHELPEFPAIGLIVSGGHTDLLLIKNHSKFKWLGGTRDDAAGEAFDKIARLLELGYPGGPAIAAEATKLKVPAKGEARQKRQSSKLKVLLPRPLLDEEGFDFSFSGLKTAALREVNKLKTMKQLGNETISYLSSEVQESITDVLVEKTITAAQKYQVKSILLGGGVTANERFREKMKFKIENLKLKIKLFSPSKSLCTDNAAVIASCAYFNYKPVPWQKIQADPGLYF